MENSILDMLQIWETWATNFNKTMISITDFHAGLRGFFPTEDPFLKNSTRAFTVTGLILKENLDTTMLSAPERGSGDQLPNTIQQIDGDIFSEYQI